MKYAFTDVLGENYLVVGPAGWSFSPILEAPGVRGAAPWEPFRVVGEVDAACFVALQENLHDFYVVPVPVAELRAVRDADWIGDSVCLARDVPEYLVAGIFVARSTVARVEMPRCYYVRGDFAVGSPRSWQRLGR